MKVLMVSHACYVAAYRKKLEEMARHPGMELTLVVPPYWQLKTGTQRLERGNEAGYRMIVDNPRLNGRHHLHYYPGLPHLLDEIRPDLVHLDEEPYDFVAAHGLFAARKRGIRVVFFTWQNLHRRFPPPFNLFERYVLGRADGAIAGNAEAIEVLRRRGFQKPVFHIPQFGVDPEVFYRREYPPAPGTLRIGYLGRLVPEKGVLDLVQAVAGLDQAWTLTIIGEGPFESALEREVARLGITEQVRFQPPIPSLQVPDLLSRLDVLVLPSRTTWHWKEQFGRVLIEAMACRVAVLGSDSGEIPHLIGDAGLVFPEGDVATLRERLSRLAADANLREALQERGYQRVVERFTQARVAGATVEAYREVLK